MFKLINQMSWASVKPLAYVVFEQLLELSAKLRCEDKFSLAIIDAFFWEILSLHSQMKGEKKKCKGTFPPLYFRSCTPEATSNIKTKIIKPKNV